METIGKESLKAAVKTVWIRALTEAPPDVVKALKAAYERESSPRGKKTLGILIENARMAAENKVVICQDTGVPTFFVKAPLGFPYRESLREAFDEALREVTHRDFPIRPMVVHPLTRKDRGDNTAEKVPLIHAELDNSIGYMEILALPKGAGTGIWSALQMLQPSVGLDGVKRFVMDAVLKTGANPCPPIIVGVGIGGPMEEVAMLATKASVRAVGSRNPEPMVAELEEDFCEALNMSGIGPMGMGGDTSVLAVNIEYAGTHQPWMPVAVNINCWCGRRAACRLYPDGRVEQM